MLWAPSSPAVRSWTAVGIRYDQPGTATPRPARRGRGFRPDRPVRMRYDALRRPRTASDARGGGTGPSTAAWCSPGRCCASWSSRASGGSSRWAWRTSSSSAQALVEFALILPLLLSLLLGSAAVGVTILSSMELHHAAIEAATPAHRRRTRTAVPWPWRRRARCSAIPRPPRRVQYRRPWWRSTWTMACRGRSRPCHPACLQLSAARYAEAQSFGALRGSPPIVGVPPRPPRLHTRRRVMGTSPSAKPWGPVIPFRASWLLLCAPGAGSAYDGRGRLRPDGQR